MIWILPKAEFKMSRLKWLVLHTFGKEPINIVDSHKNVSVKFDHVIFRILF